MGIYRKFAEGSVFDIAERILTLSAKQKLEKNRDMFIEPDGISEYAYEDVTHKSASQHDVVTRCLYSRDFALGEHEHMKLDVALDILREVIRRYVLSLKPEGLYTEEGHAKHYELGLNVWRVCYNPEVVQNSGVHEIVEAIRFCGNPAFNETEIPVHQLKCLLAEVKKDICRGWEQDGETFWKEVVYDEDGGYYSQVFDDEYCFVRDMLSVAVARQVYFNAYTDDIEHNFVMELSHECEELGEYDITQGSHPFWLGLGKEKDEIEPENSPLGIINQHVWSKNGFGDGEIVYISSDLGKFMVELFDLDLPGVKKGIS